MPSPVPVHPPLLWHRRSYALHRARDEPLTYGKADQPSTSRPVDQNWSIKHTSGQDRGVEVILTDLQPHVLALERASKASESGNLVYVLTPVDATTVTRNTMNLAQHPKQNLTANEPKDL